MIHPEVKEALETIDAAVFSGDPDVIRERLTYFMMRWQKALDSSGGCGTCGSEDCYCSNPHPPGGIS